MAVSTSSYFSIAAGSPPQIAGDFDKFQMDATPKHVIGYKVETNDGSVYRYCHFGANTNRGVVVSQDISESSVPDSDGAVVSPGSAAITGDNLSGSRYVELTLASATADQYSGGKFIPTDDDGEGYTYDILGNDATDTVASGSVRLSLAQPLQANVGSVTDFSIRGNKYANLETANTTSGTSGTLGTATDAVLAGISCKTMVVATAPYGWIQAKGVVGVLQEGAVIAAGVPVTMGRVTSGTIAANSTGVNTNIERAIVGWSVDPGDSGGHGVFDVDFQ